MYDKSLSDGKIATFITGRRGPQRNALRGQLGKPFVPKNVDALCEMGYSSKPPGEAVGNKSLGFRSVCHITDAPQVFSLLVADGPGDVFDVDCFTFAHGVELDPLLPNGPTVPWAIAHGLKKPSFQWTKGQSCTNFQSGPLKWGCSVREVDSSLPSAFFQRSARLRDTDADELFEVRRCLEGESATLAARRADEDDIAAHNENAAAAAMVAHFDNAIAAIRKARK